MMWLGAGTTAQQAEGQVVYEEKTDGIPAAAGVGGWRTVFSVKSHSFGTHICV